MAVTNINYENKKTNLTRDGSTKNLPCCYLKGLKQEINFGPIYATRLATCNHILLKSSEINHFLSVLIFTMSGCLKNPIRS